MRMLSIFACLVLAGPISVYAQTSPGQTSSTPPATPQQSTHEQAVSFQASAAATSPHIDSQEEADIHRLIELTGAERSSLQLFHASEKNMRGLMTATLPPGPYRKQLVKLFFEKFNSKVTPQALEKLAIPIYEQNFSDSDVKHLIGFYQTPFGHKFAKTMPKMLGQIQKKANAWGQKMGRQSMMEVLSEHPELARKLKQARENAAVSH